MAQTEIPRRSAGKDPEVSFQQILRPDYKILPRQRLVTVRFSGTLTIREIANYVASLKSDPQFDPAYSEIVDLRAVETLDLHGQDMLRLADKIDPFLQDSKRAFVVGDVFQSHAAKIHKILRVSAANISIFRSMEEAAAWIGTRLHSRTN